MPRLLKRGTRPLDRKRHRARWWRKGQTRTAKGKRSVTDLVNFVAAFGDALFLLPASVALFTYLYLVDPPAAAVWSRALVLCLFSVGVAKIGGRMLTEVVPADQQSGRLAAALVSTSGHAAFAAMFYASLWVVARRQLAERTHLLLYVLSAALISAVAISRLLLAAHSTLEVLVGTTLGLTFAVMFAGGMITSIGRNSSWRFYSAVLVLCGAELMSKAWEITTESVVQAISDVLIAGIGKL